VTRIEEETEPDNIALNNNNNIASHHTL
jgi:hypothetical protein